MKNSNVPNSNLFPDKRHCHSIQSKHYVKANVIPKAGYESK
ncbi:hypothetical protein Hanom_Chr09g00816061 [Helianthus anomalus]